MPVLKTNLNVLVKYCKIETQFSSFSSNRSVRFARSIDYRCWPLDDCQCTTGTARMYWFSALFCFTKSKRLNVSRRFACAFVWSWLPGPIRGAIELKILDKCMASCKNMFFTILRHFVFIGRVLKCSERSHFCKYFPDKFIKENSWKYKGIIHIFVFQFYGMKINFWVTLKPWGA